MEENVGEELRWGCGGGRSSFLEWVVKKLMREDVAFITLDTHIGIVASYLLL
jgi:hypothetical protein